MAQVAGTYSTYQSKGQREDLSDIISNISPTDTPFTSNVGEFEIEGVFYEWQQDILAAVDNTNAHIEGDDISFAAVVPTTRIGNRTQISAKSVIVTGTDEAVVKAGRKSDLAYEMAKKSKELKRDVENILCGTNQGSVAGNDTTARKVGSLLAFVKTNVDLGATGVNPVYTTEPTGTRTDGTLRPFTETILKNVIQLAYTAGGKPSTLMLGPAQKQVFSAFPGIAAIRHNVEGDSQASIIGAADMYTSDFGVLSVVPNRFQRNRDGWVLDFELIQLGFLRPYFTKPLAETGDAQKRAIIGEYGLRVLSEAGLGLAADLQ